MHEPTVCKRDIARTHYVGKGYKSPFRCPTCGRESWQHLSFLSGRLLMCNGLKLMKVQPSIKETVNDE
jgi:hypothetical protein